MRINKIWTCLGFLLFACPAVASETVDIPARTPLWNTPVMAGNVPVIANNPVSLPVESTHVSYWRSGPLYKKLEFSKVLVEGKTFWVCPIITVSQGKNPRAQFIRPPEFLVAAAIFGAILAAIAAAVFVRRRVSRVERLCDRYGAWVHISFLCALHLCGTCLLLYFGGGIYHAPSDELQYYRVAASLLKGDFGGPFAYTLGLPIIYIPFMLLTGAKNVYDIMMPVTFFFGFVLMPVLLALSWALVRRLFDSTRIAFSTVLLWLVLQRVYMPVEIRLPNTFSDFSIVGLFNDVTLRINYGLVSSGMTALSDTLSTTIVFAAFLLAWVARPSWGRYVAVGALFGFACLVRISNIFFAPLIIFIFWHFDKSSLCSVKTGLRKGIGAAGAFMAVFVIQLIVNGIQFGSPFVFPYISHGTHVSAGFEWSNVPDMTQYYMKSHFFYMASAAVGLLFLRDRFRRNVLVWWFVPLFLFLCGFGGFGQPFRFFQPLFVALIGAFVGGLSVVLTGQKKLTWALVSLFILILVWPILPMIPYGFLPENYPKICEAKVVVAIAVWIGTMIWVRRERSLLLFVLLLGFAFFASSSWLLYGALVLLLAKSVWELISDFWRHLLTGRGRVSGLESPS